MATPAEIIARWDAKIAREKMAARAKATIANDNLVPEPDGYIDCDGEMVAYWLPPKDETAEPMKETA